ncbi:hypothetical protein OLS48_00615, partial [Campylobacter jejuni]|nr:hypothetical protein [Campylobacter jejuni]
LERAKELESMVFTLFNDIKARFKN